MEHNPLPDSLSQSVSQSVIDFDCLPQSLLTQEVTASGSQAVTETMYKIRMQISVDPVAWDKFKEVCKDFETTPSAVINDMISKPEFLAKLRVVLLNKGVPKNDSNL